MSHKDSPPETPSQTACRKWWQRVQPHVSRAWGQAKSGAFLAEETRLLHEAWCAAAQSAEDVRVPDGWKLAMFVLQSGLYQQLPEEERAVCEALGQVRDWLLARANDDQMQRSVYVSDYQLREMADAIDVHLTQPTQSVDVRRAVLKSLGGYLERNWPDNPINYDEMADKLTAALQEKSNG